MAQTPNSPGRAENEAEKPGDFTALGGETKIRETGRKSRTQAGPDGPDATEVGDTFKGPKGDPAEGKRH
jgi:hypothetical protein